MQAFGAAAFFHLGVLVGIAVVLEALRVVAVVVAAVSVAGVERGTVMVVVVVLLAVGWCILP